MLSLESLADKWKAFNWAVCEVDGHDHAQLMRAMKGLPMVADRPTVILAHTIKGKGVSYMENKLEWHYRSPNLEQLQQALNELGEFER